MPKLPLLIAHLTCVGGLTAMVHTWADEPRQTVPGIKAVSSTPLSAEAREGFGGAVQPAAARERRMARVDRIEDRHAQPTAPAHKTIQIAPDARCPKWWEAAVMAGWLPETLSSMDAVIHRESRCKPRAFNQDDPNGGSRGLLQINGSWRRWLRERDVINTEEDLYDPSTNLKAAWLIYQYGIDRYGFGWGPWGFKYVDPYEVYGGGK